MRNKKPTTRFMSKEKASTEEDIQARGGTSRGCGSRFWKKDTPPHHDDHGNLKGVTCFKCKRDGHMVRIVHSITSRNRQKRKFKLAELEGVALISGTMNRSDEWFIDSAATKHMTNDRSILDNFVEYQQPKNSYLGDSTVIHALGKGKIRLPTVNSSHEVIHDVVLDLHSVVCTKADQEPTFSTCNGIGGSRNSL